MKIGFLSACLLLVMICLNSFGQTELSGIISSDATLLKSFSPYSLTGALTVKNNAVLTIEDGCSINLGSYNIFIGSGTAGKIIANNVTFSTSSSTEKNIDFKDGGQGDLSNCHFDKVYIRVEDDAGSNLSFTSNSFSNIKFPFKISPNVIPVISGNSSSVEKIGLQGNVNHSNTLLKSQWGYELTATVNIQSNATLTIDKDVSIDFKNYTITVGYSTPGTLIANQVSFSSTYQSESKIIFKDGGTGNISNSSFNKVVISVESDAGNDISITGNDFANIDFPIKLDVNKFPVISDNTSTNERIGLTGTAVNDITLNKYEWDYTLIANVSVNKSKTLTINDGVTIDLNRYFIAAGYTTSGILELSNANLSSTYNNGGYLYFRDGGSGSVSNCSFDNVYIKVEDDADDEISVTENQFSNITYPVEISANKAPVISGNTGSSEKIGLFGYVTTNNVLPAYQWPYELVESITIKSNATLEFASSAIVNLSTKYINVGTGTSSPGTLIASNVYFRGQPNNRGRINFRASSEGNLYECSFDQCYIKIDNCSPTFQNSRFFHSETAIEVVNDADPVLNNNDFYNNVLAIKHTGTVQLNATNNYWGHITGPQHADNLIGIGELIEGDIDFNPFNGIPNTGTVNGIASPTTFTLGMLSTGEKVDTSFTITNEGNIDLLITNVHNNTSNVSVQSYDRFWLYPDSSMNVNFSFTSLSSGTEKDTITISTNNTNNPELEIMISAIGHIEEISINFNKINIDSFPLVKCYFTVVDQANIPIGDIEKSFITLKEDGNIIPSFNFITKSDVLSTVSATLVIDQSGSMQGQKLRDAKNAATGFVNELSANDIASVISFNGEVRLREDFTSDKTELINAINGLSAFDETALFDAIALAIDSIKFKPGNKAIIALTDGMDNSSHVTPDILVSYALQYGISIYTIGLGEDAEESTIQYISNLTGGDYYYAPTSEILSIIYKRISGQLQNQYLITYEAPVDNPFPRTIELTINYYGLTVTDSIKYTTEKQKIDFLTGTKPFVLDEFTKNSKSYFYYKTSSPDNDLSIGEELMFIEKFGTTYIPFGGTYLGDSIFQFWADLPEVLNRQTLTISLPDSIIHNGSWIKFTNKPAPFEIPLVNYPVSQSIDIFAGGSLGVKVIAGGVAAGPSIAAASLSVKGTAGMGLNFEVDSKGNELITRRFEAGVGAEVESPAINGVVGDVQAGIEAGVMVKGTLGQTMLFPKTMDNDAIKAKTLFLLETFSLGALSLSPDCSILKQAIKQSLSLLDNGLAGAYNEHYYSNLYGVNIEGKASLGFSVASGEGSKQNKLKMAEVGGSMVFSGEFLTYPQNNNMAINFGYALEGGFSVLSLKVGNVELGKLLDCTAGLDYTLGANFSAEDGFHSLDLAMGLSKSNSIIFGQLQQREEINFNVPKRVILRALSQENIIRGVAPFFGSSFPKMDFQIGADYFRNSINDMFEYTTGSLDSVEDHIVIEVSEANAKCLEIDASVDIDAALIIGGGLKLGVTLSYSDEMSTISNQSTIVNGDLLPLATYNSNNTDNLFSIGDEIKFLLKNTPALIKDLINALIKVIGEAIEAGVDFAIETWDGTCTFTGNLISSGTTIITSGWTEIASYKPSLSSLNPLKSAFTEPQIIDAYMSRKVVNSSGEKIGENDLQEAILYLISNCYRVNIYNDEGVIIPVFDPSLLTIAIDQEMTEVYGFSEDDKMLAKMYYYDFASLNWEEIADDLNEDPDTVAALVDRSGTYAIGIVFDPERDNTAPEIQGNYPVDGGVYDPDSIFWAKLYEPTLSAGLDPGNSTLEIDGAEVEALWDPINNIISFKPVTSLSLGSHTFKITATDLNNNKTEKEITFTVNRLATGYNTGRNDIAIHCYPNPVNHFLSIELSGCNNGITEISIYNQVGQKIKILYNGEISNYLQINSWDRTDDRGLMVSPGIYFVRVKNDNKILVKKIIAQ
jgi:VWFA-related protein